MTLLVVGGFVTLLGLLAILATGAGREGALMVLPGIASIIVGLLLFIIAGLIQVWS